MSVMEVKTTLLRFFPRSIIKSSISLKSSCLSMTPFKKKPTRQDSCFIS
jgi:hypothetical protein